MSLYWQLFLASLFWGSNVIVMKIVLNNISYLMLALLRVFLSFISLGIYMFYKHMPFHYNEHFKVLIIGIFGIYLNFIFTFMGMQEVSGQNNALINALAPVLTFLFSMVILRQNGNRYDYMALILAGLAFLISIHFDLSDIHLGFIYLLIGMMMYLLSNIFIQKYQLQHCYQIIFYELLYGLLFLIIHSNIIHVFDIHSLIKLSLFDWLLLIIISGIGFAFIQITYMKSIHMIGAYKTSFYLSLNPIITYIESIIFLKESIDITHLLSFVFIILSIYMIHHTQHIS